VDSEVEGKTYVMTSDGHAELARWWEAADIDSPPPRDELMLKILTALDGGSEFALKVVEKHRSVLTSLLQERRQNMRSNSETSDWFAMQLVTDALMFRAEADLRWLDQCESRILKLEGAK
jgi:DNA-binding PadR family transcriptional regulator